MGVFSSLAKSLHDGAQNISTMYNEAKKEITNSFGPQIDQLKGCKEVYDASRKFVSAIVADASAGMSVENAAKLAADFDSGWDAWAKSVNEIYSKLSPTSQANILETFAKANFGDAVFNTGSVIKNETPNVLSSILEFRTGINMFKGSYSNPQEAMARVQTGVNTIVGAVEKMASSLNNISKLVLGHGDPSNVNDIGGLAALANLHDLKVFKVFNSALNAGQGAFSVAGDLGALGNALKAKDPKAAISAGTKLYKDVKDVIKSVKNGTAKTPGVNKSPQKASNAKETPAQQEEDSSDDSNGSGDSYVCSGATLKCPFGTSTAKLTVYPDRTVFLTSQPFANITDHGSLYNIASFGKCRSLAYPPTAAATAAAHGKLTPVKCVPGTHTLWVGGKDDVLIKGDPALLKSSICICCYGGVIRITDDGQK